MGFEFMFVQIQVQIEFSDFKSTMNRFNNQICLYIYNIEQQVVYCNLNKIICGCT